MEIKNQKIRPMCGNCVHIEEWYPFRYPGLEFCGYEGKQEYVDPYQRPCDFYEKWNNPKYAKENN